MLFSYTRPAPVLGKMGHRDRGRHTVSDDEVTAELETAAFAASGDEDDEEQRHQDDEQHNPPTPG